MITITKQWLKILGLFALLLICSSCVEILGRLFGLGAPDPEDVVYNMSFSFQDASGNDLVKGIGLDWWMGSPYIPEEQAKSGGVNRDLYDLDIILSEPCQSWDNSIHTPAGSNTYLTLGMKIYDNGYCYLTNDYFSVPVGDCPEEKILTYKLKCPYVFGDEAVHELVTYWDIPKKKILSSYYAKCYRIEFEGKEITSQLYTYPMTNPVPVQNETYAATIILDKKENQ